MHIFCEANFVADASVDRGHTLNVYKFGLMKLCVLGRLTPLVGVAVVDFLCNFYFFFKEK